MMKKTVWRLLLVLLLTLLIPAATAADRDVYYPEADMHVQLPEGWNYLTREMAKDPAIAGSYGMTTEEMQEWLSGDFVGVFYPVASEHYASVYVMENVMPWSLDMLGTVAREDYLQGIINELASQGLKIKESFWVELGGRYWCCVKVNVQLNGTTESETILHTLQRDRIVEVLIDNYADNLGLDPVIEAVMQTVTFEQEPYTVEGYPEMTPAMEDYQITDSIYLDIPKNWTVSSGDDAVFLNHAFMDFGAILVKEDDVWNGLGDVEDSGVTREDIDMDFMTGQEYRQ